MKAFNGDPELKAELLKGLRTARENDKLIKGIYWNEENQCGCLIGQLCELLNCNDLLWPRRYAALKEKLALPIGIFDLADDLFERLPDEESQLWPEEFLRAIPIGAEFDFIFHKSDFKTDNVTYSQLKVEFLKWLEGHNA